MNATTKFEGRLQLDFGDWGNAGRIAITLGEIKYHDIVLEKGFMSDGASTPVYGWWFMPPWGDIGTVAALYHDLATQRLKEGRPLPGYETRKKCDQLFYDCLIDLMVAELKARIAWLGVRAFSVFVEKQPL